MRTISQETMEWLQFLGIGRALLAAIALVFALRGRYWLLAGAAACGFVVSILVSLGTAQIVTGALAYGLYGLIAAHALDVTRQVHPRREPKPKR